MVDAFLWEHDLSEDPLPHHAFEGADCPVGEWGEEFGGLEVRLGLCSYFVGAQPLLVGLEPGQRIALEAWHNTLVSEEPAQGHIALSIKEVVIWEKTEDIPGEAKAWTEEFESPVFAAEGELVVLHLHNHGYNSWNFHSLETEVVQ